MTPLAAGSAIKPTALGVGVDGGCEMNFWARFFGVDGVSMVLAVGEVFLLRDGAGANGGGKAVAWALRRADRRLDMVEFAINVGFAACNRDVILVEMGL